MPTKQRWGAWTTQDEIIFIRKLGEHRRNSWEDHRGDTPRAVILKRYRRALERRVDWLSVDPAKVFAELDHQIQQEEERREVH